MDEVKKAVPKILVVGVGGCGKKNIEQLYDSGIEGIDLLSVDTEASREMIEERRRKSQEENEMILAKVGIINPAKKQEHYEKEIKNVSDKKYREICIGENVAKGMGTAGNLEKGQYAAEESCKIIADMLKPYDLILIICGMGGGTGAGAGPIVARIAREMNILTIGMVVKPFSFEHKKRNDNYAIGKKRIEEIVDTLLIFENDRILDMADLKAPAKDGLNIINENIKQTVCDIVNHLESDNPLDVIVKFFDGQEKRIFTLVREI